jgi:Glycosyl hydrolase family 45.
MKKLILAIYLFSLAGLVTSSCDCCDQCGTQEEQQEEVVLSGECPAIKYVSGGLSGSGFASRYWDCCKPSCSWTSNAGAGNEARQCTTSMSLISDYNAASKCDGGPSTTCLSQIPFTIDGCDNLGFAFGAVPGAGPNVCGRCFLLEFTGTGKYETKKNHRLLANKKLIVMASNIGYDVAGGQFDVMIPGGGVGIFNGCSDILGTNLGAQYGGLLSDCENQVGYSLNDDDMYTQRKECLINKCNTLFSGKALAKQGCLFLANFLEAAGNPLHTYREIECPQVLKDRY